MNQTSTAEFINPTFKYAVIGATTDHTKYGYRVLNDLAGAGLAVVGINPRYSNIDGLSVYSNLGAVPDKPDVVIFVVPPMIGLDLLDEVARLKITRVWFQPGAENVAIKEKIKQLGLIGQAEGACIMVARRTLKTDA